MSDPTSPDRVPLDRPPVPRFNPLPDLPDLPEVPRGSTPAPTPSVPIPAPPPMSSLPAPRVVVDLPRPSPSVTIDAPPRPTPRATLPTPKPPEPTPPAPTPAPQGRWVGEAISTLVRPTKSKATVVAAAGSLVAGAFALQLLVGHGLPSPPPTDRTVTAKVAEKPPETPAAVPETSGEITMPALPAPVPTETPVVAAPFPSLAKLDPIPLPRPPEGMLPPAKITPAEFPYRDSNVVPATAQTPAGPVIPVLPEPPATPAAPLPPAPATPVALPSMPAPVAALVPPTPEPAKITVPTLPPEGPKAAALPVLPKKPAEPALKTADEPNPFDVLKVKPAPALPATPVAPAVPAFKFDPDPPAPAPRLPPPAVPALPSAFVPVEPPPEPIRVAPTPQVPAPAGDARTDFDVDLHPAQAGQTYEAVSKQHYGDAKYADALRAFNRNRDPGRDELQLPPTHALRKYATAGRTTPANPIAPAGGESWAPPAALGNAKPAAGRSYTVTQDGTTFRDLAGTLLNDRAKYRRISDLNPTIDPNAKLQKGDKVAVP